MLDILIQICCDLCQKNNINNWGYLFSTFVKMGKIKKKSQLIGNSDNLILFVEVV